MELTTQQQTTAFLWAFVLGAVIEIIYFVIASIRAAVPPDKAHIFVVDLLFMLFVSCLNILYAISQTEGKVRLYVIFAETLSFVILYFTIGRFLKQKLSVLVLGFIKIYNKHTKKAINKYIQMSLYLRQKYGILHRKEKK